MPPIQTGGISVKAGTIEILRLRLRLVLERSEGMTHKKRTAIIDGPFKSNILATAYKRLAHLILQSIG